MLSGRTPQAAADAANIHACAALLGDRGVIVLGPSGTGKTTLALALVTRVRASGRFAALVADDRLIVRAVSGRLLGEVPQAIAGLAEIYGIGPRGVAFERRFVADLAVRLVPSGETERLAPPGTAEIAGVRLPEIAVSERNTAAAIPLVLCLLGMPI